LVRRIAHKPELPRKGVSTYVDYRGLPIHRGFVALGDASAETRIIGSQLFGGEFTRNRIRDTLLASFMTTFFICSFTLPYPDRSATYGTTLGAVTSLWLVNIVTPPSCIPACWDPSSPMYCPARPCSQRRERGNTWLRRRSSAPRLRSEA
jgi:hypothetical protein